VKKRKYQRPVRYKILRCTVCGNEIIVPRKPGRDKPPGHIKHMWCYRCMKTTAHEEQGRV
jgi:hypothetical protein